MILSKYNNLVAQPNKEDCVVYNSLSGNILLLNNRARKKIFDEKLKLLPDELSVLSNNKFIFRSRLEEKKFSKKIEAGLKKGRCNTVRVSFLWSEKFVDNSFVAYAVNYVNELCKHNKKVSIEHYMYAPLTKTTMQSLVVNLEKISKLCTQRFILNPLAVNINIFRMLKKAGIRDILCVMDKRFGVDDPTFLKYLGRCFTRVKAISQFGIYTPVVYNIDSEQINNYSEYFHFFMHRGATRFIVPNCQMS